MKMQNEFDQLKEKQPVKYLLCYNFASTSFVYKSMGSSDHPYFNTLLQTKIIEAEWVHIYTRIENDLFYLAKFNEYLLIIALEQVKGFNKVLFDLSVNEFCNKALIS